MVAERRDVQGIHQGFGRPLNGHRQRDGPLALDFSSLISFPDCVTGNLACGGKRTWRVTASQGRTSSREA